MSFQEGTRMLYCCEFTVPEREKEQPRSFAKSCRILKNIPPTYYIRLNHMEHCFVCCAQVQSYQCFTGKRKSFWYVYSREYSSKQHNRIGDLLQKTLIFFYDFYIAFNVKNKTLTKCNQTLLSVGGTATKRFFCP